MTFSGHTTAHQAPVPSKQQLLDRQWLQVNASSREPSSTYLLFALCGQSDLKATLRRKQNAAFLSHCTGLAQSLRGPADLRRCRPSAPASMTLRTSRTLYAVLTSTGARSTVMDYRHATPAIVHGCIQILHKLMQNILQHPGDPAFRQVSFRSATHRPRLAMLQCASSLPLLCRFGQRAKHFQELKL